MRTLLLVVALSGCGKSSLPVRTIMVDSHSVKVEVAALPDTRATGLMNRDSMPADEGMLFIYPNEAPRSFWMKNTRIPLDIAFISRDGTIVRIAQMQPFQETRTQSLYPATYALEMNLNWFESHDVQEGDKVTAIPTDVEVQ